MDSKPSRHPRPRPMRRARWSRHSRPFHGLIPTGEYPRLAEMLTEHAMKPCCDRADELELGQDLILGCLERLRG